ncbi:MAG: hypothetical protein M1838_001809 [Thelocarpon superellum]|nr:MAG: hypothetical protein M1838_001809 [Thelocarpon superellum]
MSEKTDAPPTSKTYNGGCHCGAVDFTVKLAPPLEEQAVMSCNCSICACHGYLFVYPDGDDVTFHKGRDELKVYTFGRETIKHSFCPTCGTSVLGEPIDSATYGGKLGVNARTFRDVDLNALKLTHYDGKSRV